jgi:hypothetical protein
MLDQFAAEIRKHPVLARTARRVHRWLPGWRRQPRPPAAEPTIAQQWDQYARAHGDASAGSLGEEWNDPAKVGVDVPADQIVRMLDETVFSPFLAHCDVMLEIGPGGGRFTEILLPKCEQLIAADTSAAMLDLLRERFPSAAGKLRCMLLDGRGLSARERRIRRRRLQLRRFRSPPALGHLQLPAGDVPSPQAWRTSNRSARQYVLGARLAEVPYRRPDIAQRSQAGRQLHGHDARADEWIC